MLSFVPFIYKSNCCYSRESTIKYFIVQALASTLLLFSIIIIELNQELRFKNEINPSITILFVSLMIKLGLVPTHSWFPEVSEGLDWFSLTLLLTWQKLAPIRIFIRIINFRFIIIFVVIISSLVRGLIGINQIRTRKILAYSSINHIRWIIFRIIWSFKIWILYFLIYSISNIFITLILSKFNINKLNQVYSLNLSITLKICFLINFLSLRGLPPIIGFLPKWLTISMNSLIRIEFVSIILILSTLLSIFFYIRIIIPFIFLKISLKKVNYKTLKFNFIYVSINLIFLFRLPITNLLM